MRIALGPQRKRRLWAALLALAMLLTALVLGLRAARAPAEGVQSKLDAKQNQLDKVLQHKGVLTTTISHYSDRIGNLEGQVAALRNREAAVQRKLDGKQAQLDRAMAELKREKAHLLVVRAHLKRALVGLRQRLVSMYESGTPDVITVLLNSKGWSDLVTRTEYMNRLQNQDQLLVGRVRELRNETRAVVDRLRAAKDRIKAARDAIAVHKQELVRTRSSIEAHQSKLESARGKREDALAKITAHEQELDGDVADLQAKIASQLAGPSIALAAGPIRGGSSGIIWPVNGPVVSGFGMRWGSMHEGVDIAVPTGTPIRAAASGTVAIAAPTGGYGNYTCVDHGGGLSTCYGHQESFAVSSGQSVSQGQVIGYSDCTGHCLGPHVHFEVRINGTAVDPMGYL
ncbi:MAG TPA: peptidoglycan DD-metalloendopeptidase family protein [Solirubrobacterales bacterium]|jgi:murein DD-endopeptidase MepM/ murein hydrolase activator NlpD